MNPTHVVCSEGRVSVVCDDGSESVTTVVSKGLVSSDPDNNEAGRSLR